MGETIDGLGTDLVEIERIREAVERHGERFIDKLFTEKEKRYCQQYQDPFPRYAGRFAVKEAILKTFGGELESDITWHEMEVLNDASGQPQVTLSERLQRLFPRARLAVSISHCRTYATATAIRVGVSHGAT